MSLRPGIDALLFPLAGDEVQLAQRSAHSVHGAGDADHPLPGQRCQLHPRLLHSSRERGLQAGQSTTAPTFAAILAPTGAHQAPRSSHFASEH